MIFTVIILLVVLTCIYTAFICASHFELKSSRIEPFLAEQKTVIEYIDMYTKVAAINKSILETIASSERCLAEQSNDTEDVIVKASKTIDDYFAFQEKEADFFVREQNKFIKAYTKLKNMANQCEKSMVIFSKKMDFSASVIEYYGEAEPLGKDINISFKSIFLQRDAEYMKYTIGMLDTLNSIKNICSRLQSYPKPYSDMARLYTAKMEAAMQSYIDINLMIQKKLSEMM
jgi:hypothetical protein